MGFKYKGYLLRSKSVLDKNDLWTMEVSVIRNDVSEAEAKEQTFFSENTFAIKEMADMEGIIYARKIIDREIDGLSVDELNRN